MLTDTDTDEAGALMAAERLHVAVSQMAVPGVRAQVTVSIGVNVKRPGDDVDSLLRRADSAWYAAKQGGRNRVVHVMPALA